MELEPFRECLSAPEKPHIQELYALPAKWKTVLILHYFEGYSVKETGEILGLSESAVKKRLQRARDALKLELKSCQIGRASCRERVYTPV